MSLFNFNEAELLTFFAILVRYSVLMSVLPFFGDRFVPIPVKILLSLALSVCLYPMLVSRGEVNPHDAWVWGATTSGIFTTVATEALLALLLGYIARLAFDAISFGGNLMGTFMGFAMASTYDPQQQAQTQVVAELQIALAMLLFLAVDGHHLMLAASMQSYSIIGIGGKGILQEGGFTPAFLQKVLDLSWQSIRFGIQIAAPMAVVLFGVNVGFGVLAKTMPQLNVLALSVGVSAIIGLMVMFVTLGEFQGLVSNAFSGMADQIEAVLRGLALGK